MSLCPKLGYLCLSENPTAEAGRALIRQFVLVREADRMGYDDIWLGEQHDDLVWPQAAAGVLLGNLAAVTSKARIGAMTLLPALRDAQALAESIGTLDLLSKGRFELGIASGAAFGTMLEKRGLNPQAARERMRSTMDEVQALLQQAPDAPGGLIPRPAQAPVPTWLAADDEASLRWAAQQGWGLMAAATHTRSRIERALRIYTEASAGRRPALVLARFACSAEARDDALAIAQPYFEAFSTKARAAGWGTDPQRSMAQSMEALVADSLVGSHAEVAEQFKNWGQRLGGRVSSLRIAIVPTSGQFDTHKHILADFVDEVRPLLDD